MKRDFVSLAAVLILALFAVGAVWVLPSHAEPSRFYPYTGLVLHVEDGLKPRPWAELGTSYSLGRLAPSVTGQLALNGQFTVGADIRLRYKF